jgi:hypothetical protein
MALWSFKTDLVRPEGTGTWTFAPIPVDLAAQTGSKARLRVKGTVDGFPFRGTLLPFGSGRHFVVVKRELRAKIGKGVGDRVKITMDLDTSPVVVAVPRDLFAAMRSRPGVKVEFEKMAPSHRKGFVEWIEGAKGKDTRARRIAKAVIMISEGKKL